MTETAPETAKDVRPYFRALNSSRAVRRGMVRVMNDMKAGRIPHQVGGKMLYGLNCVQGSLDSELIEQRIAALEAQAESRVIPGVAQEVPRPSLALVVNDAEV